MADGNGSLDFAGPEWVQEASRYMGELISPLSDRLAGIRFTYVEEFTDPPAHLAQDTGRVAWYLAIDGPNVEIGTGVPDGKSPSVTADYRFAVGEARKPAQRGEMTGVLAPVFADFHDHMAAVTAPIGGD